MKIIAEIGSNIKSFEDCIYSIEKARESGANIVKFQLLSKFDLYGEGSKEYSPFKIEWLEPLYKIAKQNEIEFMCTGFSVEGYKAINPFVNRHKIASAEVTAIDLLEAVASFKKPIVLSTGGATLDQIQSALYILKGCPVTIMYCVPKYPAKVVSLGCIERMREIYGPFYSYGYSDHTIDAIYLPLLFKNEGIVLLEKHVNFLNYSDTPDSIHALNFQEFSIMTRIIRGENISSDEVDNYNNKEMRDKWQRRIINGNYLRPKPE